MINPEIGTGLHVFSVDIMHTLHLGVLKQYISFALWTLIKADAFETRIGSVENRVHASIQRMLSLLWPLAFAYCTC